MCRVSGSLETGFRTAGCAHRFQVLLLALGLGKAGLGDRGYLAVLLPHPGDGLLRGLIAGIDLGGVQKLRQRSLFIARIQQLLSLGHVHSRSGNAHAIESLAESQVLGSFGMSFLVVVKGSVVVLASPRRSGRA